MFCLYFIEKRLTGGGGSKMVERGGGTIGAGFAPRYIVKKGPVSYILKHDLFDFMITLA